MKEDKVRYCKYCKEEIKADAIKCKHCHSRLSADLPDHEGVCPFCREDIKPEAVKCKHCKTSLSLATDSDCGCNNVNGSEQTVALRMTRGRFGLNQGAATWACIGDVMHCRDENGTWTPCGSCDGGWDDSKMPAFQGRFAFK